MALIPAMLATLLIFLAGTTGLQAATYDGTLSSQFTGFEPAQPRAGIPFHANTIAGPCEYLSAEPASATLVSLENGVVTVRIPGGIDISCNQDIAPRQFLLPALPAGNYRVDLVLYMVDFPGDYGTPAGYIGGRDLLVVPALTATRIPAMDDFAILGLAMLFALLGTRRVWMHRNS